MIQLKILTEKLKTELNLLHETYDKNVQVQRKRDREFFEYVKQQSIPSFNLIEKWYELTLNILRHDHLPVYEEQVGATKQNFEMLILHSYYGDVRKRRYVEMNRSCLYVFDQLLKGIE